MTKYFILMILLLLLLFSSSSFSSSSSSPPLLKKQELKIFSYHCPERFLLSQSQHSVHHPLLCSWKNSAVFHSIIRQGTFFASTRSLLVSASFPALFTSKVTELHFDQYIVIKD